MTSLRRLGVRTIPGITASATGMLGTMRVAAMMNGATLVATATSAITWADMAWAITPSPAPSTIWT